MLNNAKKYSVFCLRLIVFWFGLQLILSQISLLNSVLRLLNRQLPLDFNDYENKVCFVPEWNRVTLQNVPYSERFQKWASKGIGAFRHIQDAQVRLLSAFVYSDQISIVTTSQNSDNKRVACRYYDCNRHEIPSTSFDTVVVPMTVITCPRRYGAEFVSITFDENETPHEPIPLTYRIYHEPIHELSVCVGPLYGKNNKWLEIVEYVEHYKLVGVSYFYFTLFNLNEYDRKIVDYYSKFGYAEYTTYVTEYHRLGWLFHLIQTQDCHHRSRHHSKWVINVDIDERIVYTGSNNLIHFLRSMPPSIGELSITANRILTTGKIPEKLKNFADLQSELTFLKYNKTTEISWYNFKGIIRPDLVYVLFYHWSFRQKRNVHVISVPKQIVHLRHYRSVDQNALNGNWMEFYNGTFKETRLAPDFEQQLIENVKEKVKYVYDQRWVRCEETPETLTKLFSKYILDCK